MNILKTSLFTMVSLSVSGMVFAAGFDGRTNLLCTATEIQECDAAHGCRLVEADDAYHMQHLDVDLKKKTITLAHLETGFSSDIEQVETVEDKLVLQGIEHGTGDDVDGGGWTMTIDNEYGTMIFTMAGQGYAFVGMGGCVQAR